MIIINDNDFSNLYDESSRKIKEWITKKIKLLLACVVIKTLIIWILKSLVTTIITVIIIINNSNL